MVPRARYPAPDLAPMPDAQAIGGAKMPQPYRDLLVHRNDMTSTLESYWSSRVRLRVLNRFQSEQALVRLVVIVTESDKTPVEFGAVKIQLNRFDDTMRHLITEGRLPLGRILQDHSVAYNSRPDGFFSVASDKVMTVSLKMTGQQTLYGRRNLLAGANGAMLAQVIEILPSMDLPQEKESSADG